jgi:formamidopyrimidine-DNA glycosylase
MPELPEVEHTRKNLVRWMQGARIAGVRTSDARIVRPLRPAAFVRALAGRRVVGIERRGKWLKAMLDDGRRLFVHLGMTGSFERLDEGQHEPRFTRVLFDVVRGARSRNVAYVDSRRWGRLLLADVDVPTWTSLGPDPLTDGIDVDALAAKLARRKRRTIKEALMDQSILAGVGNIQAIEALWKARIDPRSPASAMSRADLQAIAKGLRWTITRTLADLAKEEDRPAKLLSQSREDERAASPFRIYGRTVCPRCGSALARVILGGRTTTFCPTCQRRR